MREEILGKLDELEQEHNVRILYACESGSRAWGFASPDSDYDVRFIYIHTKDWYLSIDDKRDVIELPVNAVLDINGWDIRKALKLFRNSNAPLYEWLQSPIVYKKDDGFHELITGQMHAYFSLRAGLHHYTSMARNTLLNDLNGTDVRLKKCFYALRPLLAAMWIAERNELPPMEFGKLRVLIKDASLQREIDALLEKKVQADEKATIPAIRSLNGFIETGLAVCDEAAKSIERKEADTEQLNNIFRRLVHEL